MTVEQPLRLRVDLGAARRGAFRDVCSEAGEDALADLVDAAAERLGAGPHDDFGAFLEQLTPLARTASLKLTAKRKKLLQSDLAERDEGASPLLKKVHRAGSVEPDPLRGLFEVTLDAVARVVEYEPDGDLRDTEQVPLLEDGGIEAFFFVVRVSPYALDAWFVASSIKIGYESQLHPVLLQAPAAAPPATRFAKRSSRSSRRPTGLLSGDRRGGERMITELQTLSGHEALGGGVARGRA